MKKTYNNINLEGKSDNFIEFIESFKIKSRDTAEDLNITALSNLHPEEITIAEDLLIEMLSNSMDDRVPKALYYIKCKKAIPALRKNLFKKKGEMGVEIAAALWSLTKDDTIADVIISLLKTDEDYFARNIAAYHLQNFKGAKIEKALLEAFDDEEKLVRTSSQETFFVITGLNKWTAYNKRGVTLIEYRLMSNFKSIRDPAIVELLYIVKEKRKGKTSKELGLSTEQIENSNNLKLFIQSYRKIPGIKPWQEDYDLESLSKLDTDELIWAEYACFSLLRRVDFRSIRAIVFLESKIAIEPFRELIPNAEGRFLVELINGLWVLAKDSGYKKLLLPSIQQNNDLRLKERASEVYELINS